MAIDNVTSSTTSLLNSVSMRAKSVAAMAEPSEVIQGVSNSALSTLALAREKDSVSNITIVPELNQQAEGLLDKPSLERLNESLKKAGSNILFEPDADTGKMLFLMKDAETGETIRQIPNEVVLKISRAIDDYLDNTQLDSKTATNNSLAKTLSGMLTDLSV